MTEVPRKDHMSCRPKGPHGPKLCAPSPIHPDEPECQCGCSAYEDCCPVYFNWLNRQNHLSEKHAGEFELCQVKHCIEARRLYLEMCLES